MILFPADTLFQPNASIRTAYPLCIMTGHQGGTIPFYGKFHQPAEFEAGIADGARIRRPARGIFGPCITQHPLFEFFRKINNIQRNSQLGRSLFRPGKAGGIRAEQHHGNGAYFHSGLLTKICRDRRIYSSAESHHNPSAPRQACERLIIGIHVENFRRKVSGSIGIQIRFRREAGPDSSFTLLPGKSNSSEK